MKIIIGNLWNEARYLLEKNQRDILVVIGVALAMLVLANPAI